MCQGVHACLSAASWTICQLRLNWRWVATPRGCTGPRGGLSLISSIKPPCVMAADPWQNIGCVGRPLLATNNTSSGLTSCQEEPSIYCCQEVRGDGKDGTLVHLCGASSRTPCYNDAQCLWVMKQSDDRSEGKSLVFFVELFNFFHMK